jgi:hypothetical protein
MVALLALGNFVGQHWGIYGSVVWYDIFMHILGGFSIGFSVAAAMELHGGRIGWRRTLILAVVLAAGIAWEIFEAYYDIAGAPFGTHAYWIDTVKDLIDDFIGGLLAVGIETQRILRAKG